MAAKRVLTLIGLCLFIATFSFEWVVAADAATTAVETNVPKIDEQLATRLSELAAQMSSDAFAVRRQAGIELGELGSNAVPTLVHLVRSGDRESAVRAFEILKRHTIRGNPELKAQAKDGLTELVDHTNPGIALSIRRVLHQVRSLDEEITLGRNFSLKRLVTRSGNGIRTTDVEERKRKIRLQEYDSGKIAIEVTEILDGKEAVQKFEADSPDTLKQESEEAFRLYQLFGKPKGFEALGSNFEPNRREEIQKLLGIQRAIVLKQERLKGQMKLPLPPADIAQMQREVQELNDRVRKIDSIIQAQRGMRGNGSG